MNVWEAKYKALLMGIDDQEYIDNAEKLVRIAHSLASATPYTFQETMYAMMDLVAPQQMVGTLAKLERADRAVAQLNAEGLKQ